MFMDSLVIRPRKCSQRQIMFLFASVAVSQVVSAWLTQQKSRKVMSHYKHNCSEFGTSATFHQLLRLLSLSNREFKVFLNIS